MTAARWASTFLWISHPARFSKKKKRKKANEAQSESESVASTCMRNCRVHQGGLEWKGARLQQYTHTSVSRYTLTQWMEMLSKKKAAGSENLTVMR